MAQRDVDAGACRRVELAIGELKALSVPPCVAVQYLPKIVEGRFSPASVAEIVECEPALGAAILSLAQRRSAGPAGQRHAIRLVLDRLDACDVRDTLLGAKVTAGFEIEFAGAQPTVPSHEDLTLHSLAVACCARRIAEAAPAQVDPMLAYSAGLLHDIGKYALREIMPRSLAAIVQEAQATQASLHTVEHRHLGTHHALLGKRLAQHWRLPEAITLAIWLHHSDPVARSENIREAQTVRIVWAADHLSRAAGIGQSGSFDPPQSLKDVAAVLDVSPEILRGIHDALSENVTQKAKALGLDTPNPTARYCDLIQTSAAELSTLHTQLSRESRDLQTASQYLGFAAEFLRGVDPGVEAISVARDFARRWQRFFQTGSVCIFLPGAAGQGAVDAAVVEALGHSRTIVLDAPEAGPLVPPAIADRFALLPARGHIDWVLEQLEVDFDPGRTRLVPLIAGNQTVAVVAFELNYPGDPAFFAEKFEMAATMAATVLALALATQRRERLLEQLALPRARAKGQPPTPVPTADPAEALAEMAAGVAHELNDPLSVISGRAQLLAQTESDEENRRTLEQIEENAREASGVVDDLMSFAQPSTPRAAMTDVRQIIEEAVQLAGQKTQAEHVNAQVRLADEIPDVFVDSAQIVSALANIISNAIESYTDTMGPIKITAEPAGQGVTVQIRDLGCGMDAETLRKAGHPFFSAKPAGRRRGMGLSYATRLIQLNRGSLEIDSKPGDGTNVTVRLPRQ